MLSRPFFSLSEDNDMQAYTMCPTLQESDRSSFALENPFFKCSLKLFFSATKVVFLEETSKKADEVLFRKNRLGLF